MKKLLPERMESMVITMHALQMKNEPIKLKDIQKLMDFDYKQTWLTLKALQEKELVVKVGEGSKTIWVLTKKAEEALEQQSLAKIVNVKSIHQVKSFQNQNRLNPTHIGFMKQMNQFLKDHEILLQENKTLKEENIALKNKINQIKNLFNV